eukprot:jgi/Botrbrau1/21023/Bobra.0144s0036.1
MVSGKQASELFISDLTLRALGIAESYKRRTLQKNDIDEAINTTDLFDFLELRRFSLQVDIVTSDNPASAPGVEGAPNGARETLQCPGQMSTIATMQNMNDTIGMAGIDNVVNRGLLKRILGNEVSASGSYLNTLECFGTAHVLPFPFHDVGAHLNETNLRHDPQHVDDGHAMPDSSPQVDVHDGDGQGTE